MYAGTAPGVAEREASFVMTPENIAVYVQHEQDQGASENFLRRCRQVTAALYGWLPEQKAVTKALLIAWRQSLREKGYSPGTEQNYIKGINRYLDHMGWSVLRFNRGRSKDIAGMQFGYLTAVEPTGEKNRKDRIWRCRCKCGREVEYQATRLLTGNTLSCGCLRGDHLKEVNQYYDGTSIRMSIAERVYSLRSESGYTGITKKRGKWKAYIKYKGQNYSLGCYTLLEDAVKARARGKEAVQADAAALLKLYEDQCQDQHLRPNRAQIRDALEVPKREVWSETGRRARRSDNTSGVPGVIRKREKWAAKITYRKVTYQLGVFETVDDAAAARMEAESQLRKDPEGFAEWVLRRNRAKAEEKK